MSDLLHATEALLRNAPRNITLTRIAKDTGLSVSWLSDFAKGKIEDPGVRKVDCLNRYLSAVAFIKDRKSIAYADIISPSYRKQNNTGLEASVYFVYADERLIYIGSSWRLPVRFWEHVNAGKFGEYEPTAVEYVTFDLTPECEKPMRDFELACIKGLQPPLNLRGVSC